MGDKENLCRVQRDMMGGLSAFLKANLSKPSVTSMTQIDIDP